MPEAGRPSLILENGAARLVVDLLGGSFVDFQFHDQKLNPLVWNNEGPVDQLSQMSHFLCLDRWGWPSDAEAKNGMPYHGEAGLVKWRVLEAGKTAAHLTARLPIANLDVHRWIHFGKSDSFFTVTETVTNLNSLGSVLNMVQHPSIGPPFLDENTVVDANAGEGFVLANPRPNPEQRTSWWPQALDRDGQSVNMRYLKDNQDPNVVAYAIDEPIGWTTACNPARSLMIGYVWKTSDYPWFNAWRRSDEGKPFARGLEFGTTGLDWPHAELLSKGTIFGRSLFVHLDAGATLTKSFTCFLMKIPGDFAGVGSIRHEGEQLTVIERKPKDARVLSIEAVPAEAIPAKG